MAATPIVSVVSQDRCEDERQVKNRAVCKLPEQGRLPVDKREIELLTLG